MKEVCNKNEMALATATKDNGMYCKILLTGQLLTCILNWDERKPEHFQRCS